MTLPPPRVEISQEPFGRPVMASMASLLVVRPTSLPSKNIEIAKPEPDALRVSLARSESSKAMPDRVTGALKATTSSLALMMSKSRNTAPVSPLSLPRSQVLKPLPLKAMMSLV